MDGNRLAAYCFVFPSYFQPGAVPDPGCCDGGNGACPDDPADLLLGDHLSSLGIGTIAELELEVREPSLVM